MNLFKYDKDKFKQIWKLFYVGFKTNAKIDLRAYNLKNRKKMNRIGNYYT